MIKKHFYSTDRIEKSGSADLGTLFHNMRDVLQRSNTYSHVNLICIEQEND